MLIPMRAVCAAMAAAWMIAAFGGVAARAEVTITDPGQGPVAIVDTAATGATELSGLGYEGPADFISVSDNNAELYDIEINVDAATGFVTSNSITGSSVLGGAGSDLEGVAAIASPGVPGAFGVVSEAGPGIQVYDPSSLGAPSSTFAIAAAYGSGYSAATGLESLGSNDAGDFIVTANESPLTGDAASNRVRIQSYDESGVLGKQVSFELTSTAGDFLLTAANGVSDLEVLPNGDILVLERALGGNISGIFTRTIISVIKASDFAAADDTSAIGALGSETSATATPLFEMLFADQNYEGMALGEVLDDGSRSLLLISDDGVLTAGVAMFTPNQTLYPLTITPEPSALSLLGLGAVVVLRRRR